MDKCHDQMVKLKFMLIYLTIITTICMMIIAIIRFSTVISFVQYKISKTPKNGSTYAAFIHNITFVCDIFTNLKQTY